jgi:hypothetical protein
MKKSLIVPVIVAALTIPTIAFAKIDSNQSYREDTGTRLSQMENDHSGKPVLVKQSSPEYGPMPANYSQSGSPIKSTKTHRLFAHH